MHPVVITGPMVNLRELSEADAVPLHKIYGSEEATRHLSFEPKTMEQAEGIIKAATASATAEPRTEYMLAVAGTDGEMIGSARLATGEYQSGQIGFALRPDHWGQGKGLETVRLLQRLGFSELDLHRIWGARSPLNQASARTMRAAGMVQEGTTRGHLFQTRRVARLGGPLHLARRVLRLPVIDPLILRYPPAAGRLQEIGR